MVYLQASKSLLRLLIVACAAPVLAISAPSPDFGESVEPILRRACNQCHNDSEKASGFSVASLETVLRGGARHGPAVVAGHPEQSPLVQLLKGELSPKMPAGSTGQRNTRPKSFNRNVLAMRAARGLPTSGSH